MILSCSLIGRTSIGKKSQRNFYRIVLCGAALWLLEHAIEPESTRLIPMDAACVQRTILWFRNDLRVHDNPLFHHPAAQVPTRDLVCAYCADPAVFSGRLRQTGLPKIGPIRSKFIRECVEDLRSSLRQLGGDLLVASAKPEIWLPQLAQTALGIDAGAVVVVVAQGVTSEEQQEEAAVAAALAALPVPARLALTWGLSLYHIEDLPYADIRQDFPMVFAPFGRAVRGNFRAADAAAVAATRHGERGVGIRQEVRSPQSLPAVPVSLQSLSASDIASVWPQPADMDGAIYSGQGPGVAQSWWETTFFGGETSGLCRLESFVEKDLARYKDTRNGLIGLRFSSKLSPWVAAGCVSPRRAIREVRQWELRCRRGQPTPSSAHYVSEFGWRDFLIFLAMKCGASLFKLGGPGSVELLWVRDKHLVHQLFHGEIGIPLIDAAIREMSVSGFMSNRARQFVASYIVLELKLDWRIGAELFESLLIDYDVCANWGNWMRAAGVSGQGFGNGGSRWFNLAEERDRFDPQGEYVRLWLPELRKVPSRFIHAPWTMPPAEQEDAQIQIGMDYPFPPDTPSKATLEGSAPASDAAPTWYATTQGGKLDHAQNVPLKGKGGGKVSSRRKCGGAPSDSLGPSGSGAVNRRWRRKGPSHQA